MYLEVILYKVNSVTTNDFYDYKTSINGIFEPLFSDKTLDPSNLAKIKKVKWNKLGKVKFQQV